VICEYLDSIGSAPKLTPAPGPARWKALTQEALADGILDATQPRRRELTLPQDEGRKSYIALQQGKVARALVEFEKQACSLGNLDTIGEITIGCALGYLNFRYQRAVAAGQSRAHRVVREGCEAGTARRNDAGGLTWPSISCSRSAAPPPSGRSSSCCRCCRKRMAAVLQLWRLWRPDIDRCRMPIRGN
jgi:glutathione S-transferase